MAKLRRSGRPAHPDVLTPAEWRVLHAIQHGMSHREIATKRGISVNAIKYHVRNIREKLQLSDRSELRRWFGAPRGSALETGRFAMIEPTQVGAIGQISRTVSDIEQSRAWYESVLGLPHLFTFGTLSFFDCGGTRLMLTSEHGARADESILYFKVQDIRATHARLSDKDVRFVSAPHLIHRHADGTEEWMAFFMDPDGRSLALMSQVKAATD
ncbi:MAG: VOC family protein [Povalibacter sp.]